MNRVEPNRNVYVGHRYVPLLVGEWDKSIQYEGLSIVTFKGASYTSKKMTPPGIDIENEEYWVVTGNYDAQVEYYRDETERVRQELTNKSDITYVDTELGKKSDKTYVDSELDKKSDITYVDTELDKKSDITYVDTELNKKSNQTYVDTELNKKADTTFVNEELDKKMNTTTKNIDIFVEKNGNDNNDGLLPTSPVSTLSKAVDLIPDTIGKNYIFRINIGVGEWNEVLTIENKIIQGVLEIKGTTENRENHIITALRFDKLTGHTIVRNLYTTTQNSTAFMFLRCAPHVEVENVKAYGDPESDNTSTGYHGLLADYGSNVLVRYSDFSNKRYGLRSNYLSRIFSLSNTGSGNLYGVGARWGGILQMYGTAPEGVTNITTDSGSLILDGKGFSDGVPREDVYLISEQKSKHDGRTTKRLYNIVDINSRQEPINENEQLVLEFSSVQFGAVMIDIKYGGIQDSNYPQFINAVWTAGNTNYFRSDNLHVINSTEMSEDDITVESTGSGNFNIIIKPNTALRGNWGVECEVKIFRNQSAPTLNNVKIETI